MFYISRFKNIEKKEYDCEIVTPMFLGGADPGKAELRVPSLKGELRFWWRAVYGSNNIKEMIERESKIFGSTDQKSQLKIKIEHTGIIPISKNLPEGKYIEVSSKQKKFRISIIEYLAFGLFDPQKKQNKYRQYIEPGAHFKISLICPKDLNNEISESLNAMFSFGGLGSRSRNGFGSLYCLGDGVVTQSYKDGSLKSFTSFSNYSKLFDGFNAHSNWIDALSEIGEVYRKARLKLEKRHIWEKRKFIAMPIEAKFENIPEPIRHGRHAKPYFLHVNKTADGKYRGQILFLPYNYKESKDAKPSQIKEYLSVCKEMNEEIAKNIGGAR